MKNSKPISFKTQYLLSLIPYMGVFAVCFCAFYNLRRIKKQSYSFLFGYVCAVCLLMSGLMAITVLIAQNLLLLADMTPYTRAILIGMYVAALVSGLFGVWLQKRRMKQIEIEENNAYLH